MVHCLAVVGSDLWCCTGGGTIAVFDLVTLQVKNKVSIILLAAHCVVCYSRPVLRHSETTGDTAATYLHRPIVVQSKCCCRHTAMTDMSSLHHCKHCLQGFAAHNGEILAAAAIPTAGTAGSVVLTGGHDWQVHMAYAVATGRCCTL